jgi:hypothetical protein
LQGIWAALKHYARFGHDSGAELYDDSFGQEESFKNPPESSHSSDIYGMFTDNIWRMMFSFVSTFRQFVDRGRNEET